MSSNALLVEYVCTICAQTGKENFDKKDRHVCKRCLRKLLAELKIN
jgi:DNA-directed RNA polymerase subunit RPC12/RpoP